MSEVLRAVGLLPLMQRTSGSPDIKVGLVDGPVRLDHPDLVRDRLVALGSAAAAGCSRTGSAACRHGTFVAGILAAARISSAPAICPGCTLLVRPVFVEGGPEGGAMPRTTAEELARAIVECVDAGARVVNISAAVVGATASGQAALKDCLDRAAARGTIVVAAAGNDASIAGSPLTSHPWVVPVAACDGQGRPSSYSNLGPSVGRRGLLSPGDDITSLDATGGSVRLTGTSAATAFVTGAVALLWSDRPSASAAELRHAIGLPHGTRRAAIVPPRLDAWASFQALGRTTCAVHRPRATAGPRP